MAALQRTNSLSEDAIAAGSKLANRQEPIRVLYFPGPGNVVSTFQQWRHGDDDRSIPSIGYSHQIFDAVSSFEGELITWHQKDVPAMTDGNFSFFPRPAAPSSASGLGYYVREFQKVLFIADQVRAYKPDILLIQQNNQFLWALNQLLPSTVGLIISLHNTLWPMGQTPSFKTAWLAKRNSRFFAQRALGVLVVSEEIGRQLQSSAAPLTVNVQQQIPLYPRRKSEAADKGTQGFHVFFVGRLERYKGVFELLEAAVAIRKLGHEIRLTFVGAGSALEDLRNKIGALDASAWAKAPGQLPGDQMMQELQSGHLLVCPTTTGFSEGLAKTPLEAALLGMPSVVSEVVPCKELLGAAARVVEPNSVKALESAILSIMTDQTEWQDMAAATQHVRDQLFSKENTLGTQLAQLIANALGSEDVTGTR